MIEEEVDLTKRRSLEKLIGGAIKQTIQAHGSVTIDNYSSAAKRVIGVIKEWNRRVREKDT